ncbi:MAG: hypothetical protein JW891_12775 [Candidatus Lokiarchaeota archaeon]|nr:hypothetical protein [Candidatus Lokiarchaeota archaeon]
MTEQEKQPETSETHLTDKAVVLRAEAYKTIILYASRYANASIPKEDWKEIYGILVGHVKDEIVFVERAEALTYGHATDVQLDAKHYGFIEQIQEKLDQEKRGYYIIGWFHSHPGLGLFFSYVDLINQLGFQARNEDSIGLVFDHTLLGKKKVEQIGDNRLTKYDTGFEIYRLTDVNMDVNAPEYDENYHKIDYIVEGLNKFFFANVLTEISSLVAAGKPLETAYGELSSLETTIANDNKEISLNSNPPSINQDLLTEIPKSDEMVFDVDDFFYTEATNKKAKKISVIKEKADLLVYEGNKAFKQKDSFTGIEKFRTAIKQYQKINDPDRVLELLNQVCEKCLLNDHLNLAEEFIEEMLTLAKKENQLFYRGKAKYLKGYILLKIGDNRNLQHALEYIQEGAVDYIKENDFAGAGMCFHKIGSIYQLRLNDMDSACLFYKEAIVNYNNALQSQHSLRKSLWSKPESLISKLIELVDLFKELVFKIEDEGLKKKLIKEFKEISFNY